MRAELTPHQSSQSSPITVVIGCHSAKTREKRIQEGSDLTLEKAIDIARTDEMSKAQLETMANEDASINRAKPAKPKI